MARTGLSEDKQQLLHELPRLQGGGDVIERALSLADNELSRQAAQNALDVYERWSRTAYRSGCGSISA